MNDWEKSTRADYESKGFAARSGYGRMPALVIVDFIKGFTDPKSPLGGDFAWELNATRQLQEAFRRGKLPIVYTTVAYAEDLHDAGVFVKKVPSLAIFKLGSPLTEVDPSDRAPAGRKDHREKIRQLVFWHQSGHGAAPSRRRHRHPGRLHHERLHPGVGDQFPPIRLSHHRRAGGGR